MDLGRLNNEARNLIPLLLRKVSRKPGGFEHALVCRLWSTESEAAQVCVHVPGGRERSAAEVLTQISAFPGLQALHLTEKDEYSAPCRLSAAAQQPPARQSATSGDPQPLLSS